MNEELLKCPECGSLYVRLVSIGCLRGPYCEPKLIEGAYRVLHTESKDLQTGLYIEFSGECGHKWRRVFQPRRGSVYETSAMPIEESEEF